MTNTNAPYPEPHVDMECERCTTGNMATGVHTDDTETDWYVCTSCSIKMVEAEGIKL